ncbi:MAG: BACON domain-containing protein, partial [Candidatus Parabeggiatoa sp.]|nr:BACON domain-containing protein [Candidatus Parabeggiatoa sp.]
MHFYRPILGALLILLNIINLPHNKRGRERAKKRLIPQTALTLTLLLGGLSYTTADTLNMPLTFEAWQHYTLSSQGHQGQWEHTADGIRLYGSESGHGNGIMSKDRFDFRGTETLIKWQVNSFEQYSALLPHLKSLTGSALLSERFTTHHTEPGATLISDKTWYYTKITVNRDSSYTAITAQDDYDINGGFVIHSQFGTFNGAQDGYVAIYLADNDAGQLAYLTLGEVKIKPDVTFSTERPIDFNQGQRSATARQGTRQEPKTIEFDYEVIVSWKYYTKSQVPLRVTATESQCDRTETPSLTIPFEQEIILNHSNYGDCSIASTQYRIEGGEWTTFTNEQRLHYGGKLDFQIQASGVSSCQTTCTVTTIATFFNLSSTQEPHHYTGKNSVSDSIFSNVTELRKIDVATPYDGGIVRELKCDDNTNNPDVAFKCEQVEGNVVISAYYIRPVAHFNILPLYGVEPLTVELNASDSYAGTGTIKSYEWTKSGEENTILQSYSTLSWPSLNAGNHEFCLVVVNDKVERSEKVCKTLTVEACTYTITRKNDNDLGSNKDTGSLTVTTNGTRCPWKALSQESWLTIDAGPHTGKLTINYSVTDNPSTARRCGNLTVA